MDHTQQLEKLINQLYDIGEKMNEMMVPDHIRTVDVDLLKTKVANLYDDILLLAKSDATSRFVPPVQKEQPVENQPEPEADHVDADEDALFELDKKSDQDEKKEKIKEKIIEETKAQLHARDDDRLNRRVQQTEEENKLSLHDELVKKFNKPDLSSKLQSKPIKDIHKAIGLNERFTFIHELFGGDVNQYNQTISMLNEKSNFNEAFEFIEHQFDWDINSPLVQHLLNLARRKYISPNDG